MYRTKIKDKFFTGTAKSWRGGVIQGKEYNVVKTVDEMSLLCDIDTGLLVDVYNNKLEEFRLVKDTDIFVESKNLEYSERFGLNGIYKIVDCDRLEGVTRLHIRNRDGTGPLKMMFPSRLRVVELCAETGVE